MKLQEEPKISQWKQLLHQQLEIPARRAVIRLLGSFLGGFCLSAASLGNVALPLCLSVLCAGLPGWMPMSFALGSSLGYGLFWGQAGLQGLVWIAAGLALSVFLQEEKQQLPLLQPSVGALIVAISGLIFQLWQGENVSIAVYLLRIILAFGVTWLTMSLRHSTGPMTEAVAVGIGVLALGQIAPVPFLNLGFLAAGLLGAVGSFPVVTLVGLALDLTQITPVPMTAVLCLTYFARRIPLLTKRSRTVLPALVYVAMMGLCGQNHWLPVPALLLGGVCSLLPLKTAHTEEKSLEEGVQRRLESVSAVMAQTGKLLREGLVCPPDEGALILRAADRACSGCDRRKDCTVAERVKYLPPALLHQSMITGESITIDCKNRERLLGQLQHSQELYRLLLADRQRQQEYRTALGQQYGFLAGFLREMADGLPQWAEERTVRFRPEVASCSRGREAANGDRCCWFPGTKGRYYVLLCDGMGTGEGAAYEARMAAGSVRRMLIAGYSAHEAMQSLNSLCILRGQAGAVTMDLAEADLLTGRVVIYKWGAAPSWLLNGTDAEKIGRESPPPGLSLEEDRETVESVTLQNGQALLMVSDGVDAPSALAAQKEGQDQPAGFLAAMILESGVSEVPDDATAVVLRLHRVEK